MSILQLRLTFQLTINDDRHLKYSHSDWVHHFVNHRLVIGLSHTIDHEVAVEYLNNVSAHILGQLKLSKSSSWCGKRSYDYWITAITLKFNYIVDSIAKICIGQRREAHIKIALFLIDSFQLFFFSYPTRTKCFTTL